MLEAIGFGVVVAFSIIAVLVGLLALIPLTEGYMDGRRHREHRRQQLKVAAARAAYERSKLPDPEGIETSSLDSDSWNERIKEWNGNQ